METKWLNVNDKYSITFVKIESICGLASTDVHPDVGKKGFFIRYSFSSICATEDFKTRAQRDKRFEKLKKLLKIKEI